MLIRRCDQGMNYIRGITTFGIGYGIGTLVISIIGYTSTISNCVALIVLSVVAIARMFWREE